MERILNPKIGFWMSGVAAACAVFAGLSGAYWLAAFNVITSWFLWVNWSGQVDEPKEPTTNG